MISDDFIETVITPRGENSNTMDVTRELYGMEAVAQFDNDEMARGNQ